MRFWDSSALVPLVVDESVSDEVDALLDEDDQVMLWWATPVECETALCRRFREGSLSIDELQLARGTARVMFAEAQHVAPSEAVRGLATRLVEVHPLRAADAMQLAAALIWAEHQPSGRQFVTLDQRLRAVALQEGFTVRP